MSAANRPSTTAYTDAMSDRVERATVRRARRSAEKPGHKWLGDSFRDKTEHSHYWLMAVFPMLGTVALLRVVFPERVWLGVLLALSAGIVGDAVFGVWQRRRTPDVTDAIEGGQPYDPRR